MTFRISNLRALRVGGVAVRDRRGAGPRVRAEEPVHEPGVKEHLDADQNHVKLINHYNHFFGLNSWATYNYGNTTRIRF